MKLKTWIIIGMVSVGALFVSLAEEPPTVTLENTEGIKIEALILASDNTTVTFKRVGVDKVYTLPLDQLTEDTQDALLAFDLPVEYEKPAKPDVVAIPNDSFLKVDFLSGKTSKRTNPGTYDDERTDTLKPEVTIENRDSSTGVNCEMTVVVFARGVVDKRSVKVMAKKTFSLDQEPAETEVYKLEEFTFRYDARDGYNYGYKYQGYAVVFHDKEGEVLRVVASPPGYQDIPRDVLKCKMGKVYDMELIKEIKDPRK